MKTKLVALLLRLLNSQWLNASPCQYGYIGNVDAFDIQHLRYEVQARPDLTVAQLIKEAEAFKCCPLRPSGLTVIEDGVARDGTIWDIHQLRQELGGHNENPH